MTGKQIKVLLLEDEAAHAEAIRRGLESAGNVFKLQTIGSLKIYRENVAANPPDIALLDMVLPDGNGIDLLTAPPEANAFPMLILTSHGNEQAAVNALKAGALDYIVKSPETFTDMPRILTRTLNQWSLLQENKQAVKALQISEANFRSSMDNSPLGIRVVSEDGETSYTNRAFLDIYGYKDLAEFKNTPVKDRYTPESYNEFHERREKRLRREPLPDNYEVSIVRKDGTARQLQVVRKEILWGGKRQYQTIYQDVTERKQAEEMLRSKQIILARTEGIAHVGSWEWDIASDTVTWSDELFRIFQRDPQEGAPSFAEHPALYLPEDMARLRQAVEAAVAHGTPYELELRAILKDGEIRSCLARGVAEMAVGGRAVRLFGSLQDITEQKRAENKLKESEENLRISLENAPDGVYFCDLDGVFLYGNIRAEEIIGYKKEELIGNNFFNLNILPVKYLPKIGELLKLNAIGKSTGPDELELIRRDKSQVWVEISTATIKQQGNDIIIGFVRDITERKRVEEALKESEEKYRLIVENSTDIIFTLDAAGNFIYVSPSVKSVLGYNQADLLGRPFRSLVHPDDLHVIEDVIWRHNMNMPTGYNEYRFRRASGEWRWLLSTGTRMVGNAENVFNFIGVARDITEQKKAEEALKASEQNFRNSIDSSFIGVNIIDKDFHTLYANQALLDIFGYANTGELRASLPYEHYTPESHVSYVLRDERILQGEPVPDKVEVDIIRKDGAIRHLQLFRKEVLWDGKQQYQILYDDITERKQAEEALKASEEKYSTLIEKSSDGIVILDDHTIEFSNSRMCEMSGYSQNEILGNNFLDLVAPEYLERLKERYQGKRADGIKTDNFEMEILDKDKNQIPVETSAQRIAYKGRPATMVTIRDITKRKQAEEAFKISEQNFRNSLDSSLMGIRIVDGEWQTLYANQVFLDIFSYKNIDEIRAHDLQEHYTTEEYARYLLRKEKRMRGEVVPDDMKVDVVGKDGEIRHLEVFSSAVFWNGKQQRQIIYNDVTDRKKMEEALRESEEKYRLIVENTRDIIFTVNNREEYVYVSPSVKNILGYNQNELIGKPFLSLVHPEDMHIIEEETARSSVPGYQASGDNEYRIRHASGEWRWVISKGTRTVDPSGKFLYFIGVIRDITESKQADKEKHILEEKAQVASRLAAVGEMAAGIAHEINNPLTGVLGFSQMLLENKNVPEDIKENLKLIADGSQRVAEIVKRLLTFARQTKPVKAAANLNELIENTLKLREYVLKTNNINVVTRFDPELPWSVVDPGQMQQVFLNLIVNAEQAMKKAHGKGTLTITTKKIDNNIRISFQDDGPGVTAENMGHLFEPFFTTKAPGEGTGLGLSLSRSIILEHDGKMSVESEFGRGATFIIELPIIEALLSEAETATSSVKAQPEATKTGRILVVDDEAGVRTLIEKTLTRMGHSVDVIDDAGAVLDIIDAGTVYDVILTDVRMPGMSGIELYPLIIKKMPVMKNRIIFITGDVMGPDIRTFLNQNNLPYLAKPFDIELLKEKIATILNSGQT